jgi:hypothetical protein
LKIYKIELRFVHKKTGLNCSINENGFEILSPAKISVSGVDVAVQVYITTQHQNLRRLDSNIHCNLLIYINFNFLQF